MSEDDVKLGVRVVGDAEIRQSFLDFGSDVRARLRRALANAGQVIANAAAAHAPRRTGQLAGSIRARLNENGMRMTEIVAPAGRYGSFVGALMEFGVVNHGTRRNASSAKGKRARAGRVTTLRAAGQYRIQPRPFMEPAYASVRDRVQADIDAAVQGSVAEANR